MKIGATRLMGYDRHPFTETASVLAHCSYCGRQWEDEAHELGQQRLI